MNVVIDDSVTVLKVLPSPSLDSSSGRSLERGENAVSILAKSLRKSGSVVLFLPLPVTMAVFIFRFSFAQV